MGKGHGWGRAGDSAGRVLGSVQVRWGWSLALGDSHKVSQIQEWKLNPLGGESGPGGSGLEVRGPRSLHQLLVKKPTTKASAHPLIRARGGARAESHPRGGADEGGGSLGMQSVDLLRAGSRIGVSFGAGHCGVPVFLGVGKPGAWPSLGADRFGLALLGGGARTGGRGPGLHGVPQG